MRLPGLTPHPGGKRVEHLCRGCLTREGRDVHPSARAWLTGCGAQVDAVEGTLVVGGAGCGPPEPCPDCGRRASRVHCCYWRRLTGIPVAGQETLVRIHVRRFFCDYSGCRRKTSAEQICGLSERYRRGKAVPAVRAGARSPWNLEADPPNASAERCCCTAGEPAAEHAHGSADTAAGPASAGRRRVRLP
ncbi:transposase family protein [Streptomyces sp. NRAIS4]